jgi:hypothetical protein
MRDAYLAAEAAILNGQSITFAGRTLTYADLAEIRKGRKEWERKAQAEARGTAGGLRHQLADFSV